MVSAASSAPGLSDTIDREPQPVLKGSQPHLARQAPASDRSLASDAREIPCPSPHRLSTDVLGLPLQHLPSPILPVLSGDVRRQFQDTVSFPLQCCNQ